MIKRRITYFIISAILLVSMAFTSIVTSMAFANEAKEDGELHSQELVINQGETDQGLYEVWFNPNGEFTSFSLDLEFPEFVNVLGVIVNYQLGVDDDGRVGSITGGNAGQYTCDYTENAVSVALTSTQTITDDVKLFTIELSVDGNESQAGDVIVTESRFIDIEQNELSVIYNLGGIKVSTPPIGTMGDMDGDGKVETIDLIIVQRSITDLSEEYALTETQKVLADINRDGEITIVDCQLIRKYIVGILNSLDYGGEQAPVFFDVNVKVVNKSGICIDTQVEVQEGVWLLDQLFVFAQKEGLDVVGYYYDSNRLYEVGNQDLPEKNMDVYIFVAEQEAASEYYFNVYHYNETGETSYDGEWMVKADQCLVDALTEYAASREAEIEGFYTDGTLQTEISQNYTAADYHNEYGNSVWVVLSPSMARNFEIVFYVNGNQCGYQMATAGENILSVVNTWYTSEMAGEIKGVYYDAERTMPIDEVQTVSESVTIYIFTENYVEDENQVFHQIVFYSNQKGDWAVIGSGTALEGSNIYQIILEKFGGQDVMFNCAYFDAEMENSVGSDAQLKGYTEIYLDYPAYVPDSENVLYVSIKSANDDILGSEKIYVAEGDNVYDVVKKTFNIMGDVVIFYDDGEKSPVSTDTVYSKDLFNALLITAYKVEIVLCDSLNSFNTSYYTYGFSGDILYEVINRELSMHLGGQEYKLFGDAELTTEIPELINEDVTVYALIMTEQVPNAGYSVSIVETINGSYTATNGFGGSVTAGKEIIATISEEAQERVGFIYNIVGYYYDLDCTQPVGNGTFTTGHNTIYLLVELKNLVGEYPILSMEDGSTAGTFKILENNGATIILGEKTFSGTYNVVAGMILVNVGTYSQYAFIIMEMEETCVAIMALEFDGDSKPMDEKYNAVAGEYVWSTEYYDDNGEIIVEEYSMILYANGVHETVAMGMAVRGNYEIVYNNIVKVTVMGEDQYFTLDKDNGLAIENNLVEHVGTHNIDKPVFTDDKQTYEKIGEFTINYDGTASYTLNGKTVACKAEYGSGIIYLSFGEFGLVRISNYSYEEVSGYYLETFFDGNDYEENSIFDDYVGEYSFAYYDEPCTIEFLANGVFKLNRRYGSYMMGKYEVYDGYLRIYMDFEQGRFEEIAYNEEEQTYMLRHLINQGGDKNETQEKEEIIVDDKLVGLN